MTLLRQGHEKKLLDIAFQGIGFLEKHNFGCIQTISTKMKNSKATLSESLKPNAILQCINSQTKALLHDQTFEAHANFSKRIQIEQKMKKFWRPVLFEKIKYGSS